MLDISLDQKLGSSVGFRVQLWVKYSSDIAREACTYLVVNLHYVYIIDRILEDIGAPFKEIAIVIIVLDLVVGSVNGARSPVLVPKLMVQFVRCSQPFFEMPRIIEGFNEELFVVFGCQPLPQALSAVLG